MAQRKHDVLYYCTCTPLAVLIMVVTFNAYSGLHEPCKKINTSEHSYSSKLLNILLCWNDTRLWEEVMLSSSGTTKTLAALARAPFDWHKFLQGSRKPLYMLLALCCVIHKCSINIIHVNCFNACF